MKHVWLGLGIFAAVIFGGGCEPEEETAGDKIEEAGEKMGNAVDELADGVKDAADELKE
jgi:hypothetical protein